MKLEYKSESGYKVELNARTRPVESQRADGSHFNVPKVYTTDITEDGELVRRFYENEISSSYKSALRDLFLDARSEKLDAEGLVELIEKELSLLTDDPGDKITARQIKVSFWNSNL